MGLSEFVVITKAQWTQNYKLSSILYPALKISLQSLVVGRNYQRLTFRQAYHQLEMEEDSKKYLTINTHINLFQYNRLVFGITSAPAIWQRTIDQVLEGTSGTSCILDDMIITGKDDAEHLAYLEEVLRRLQLHGLRANKAKCDFFKEKITYCGHDIDKDGLHKSAEKVEAVLNAPRPNDVVEVRSLLGLINYIWWPGIDKEIELTVKSCSGCQLTQREPSTVPVHAWELPSSTWQRIRIDFEGPFLNCMFLVVVDAHSRWLEND